MTGLKRTPLTGAHERLGARMVPYAGFLMPVQYESITEEHRAVRERAGLVDHQDARFVGPHVHPRNAIDSVTNPWMQPDRGLDRRLRVQRRRIRDLEQRVLHDVASEPV